MTRDRRSERRSRTTCRIEDVDARAATADGVTERGAKRPESGAMLIDPRPGRPPRIALQPVLRMPQADDRQRMPRHSTPIARAAGGAV